MFRSLKSFFGFKDDDSAQQSGAGAAASSSVLTPANEIAEAHTRLREIQTELDGVEKSIMDSNALVARAAETEEDLRCAINSLHMEMHDTFLHPDFAGYHQHHRDDTKNKNNNKQPSATSAAGASKNNNDDDDSSVSATTTATAAQQQQQIQKNNEMTLVKLQRAARAIELSVLPQIAANRDMLDLSAFRLRLRLDKLRQEEASTQARLSEAEAEVDERRTIYTEHGVAPPTDDVMAIVDPGSAHHHHSALVPPPRLMMSAAPAAFSEHQ